MISTMRRTLCASPTLETVAAVGALVCVTDVENTHRLAMFKTLVDATEAACNSSTATTLSLAVNLLMEHLRQTVAVLPGVPKLPHQLVPGPPSSLCDGDLLASLPHLLLLASPPSSPTQKPESQSPLSHYTWIALNEATKRLTATMPQPSCQTDPIVGQVWAALATRLPPPFHIQVSTVKKWLAENKEPGNAMPVTLGPVPPCMEPLENNSRLLAIGQLLSAVALYRGRPPPQLILAVERRLHQLQLLPQRVAQSESLTQGFTSSDSLSNDTLVVLCDITLALAHMHASPGVCAVAEEPFFRYVDAFVLDSAAFKKNSHNLLHTLHRLIVSLPALIDTTLNETDGVRRRTDASSAARLPSALVDATQAEVEAIAYLHANRLAGVATAASGLAKLLFPAMRLLDMSRHLSIQTQANCVSALLVGAALREEQLQQYLQAMCSEMHGWSDSLLQEILRRLPDLTALRLPRLEGVSPSAMAFDVCKPRALNFGLLVDFALNDITRRLLTTEALEAPAGLLRPFTDTNLLSRLIAQPSVAALHKLVGLLLQPTDHSQLEASPNPELALLLIAAISKARPLAFAQDAELQKLLLDANLPLSTWIETQASVDAAVLCLRLYTWMAKTSSPEAVGLPRVTESVCQLITTKNTKLDLSQAQVLLGGLLQQTTDAPTNRISQKPGDVSLKILWRCAAAVRRATTQSATQTAKGTEAASLTNIQPELVAGDLLLMFKRFVDLYPSTANDVRMALGMNVQFPSGEWRERAKASPSDSVGFREGAGTRLKNFFSSRYFILVSSTLQSLLLKVIRPPPLPVNSALADSLEYERKIGALLRASVKNIQTTANDRREKLKDHFRVHENNQRHQAGSSEK
eukprot:GHVT01096990.1.p1 GENE.GHVT01096990.1~~GHVT01096990.1.p1  ORF type:complete len:863 (+),score=105.51 GHVT01096990.1:368-2956(+)